MDDMGLITLQEAARRLQVSRATLYRWSREGRIRLYQVGPRATRMREEDLTRLEAEARPVHDPRQLDRDPLWEQAREADLTRALKDVEGELPDLTSYLRDLARSGIPVRWSADLEEFEVAGS
ncbi:MAG: helix-turn-helix domain-containing protein [Armatimonadetes bacterium]|nr:helix-turn-helix domain-containing protein [Armatimonadota bacterium]